MKFFMAALAVNAKSVPPAVAGGSKRRDAQCWLCSDPPAIAGGTDDWSQVVLTKCQANE
jgi:hypothetical protein